jgi:hypothetical protein
MINKFIPFVTLVFLLISCSKKDKPISLICGERENNSLSFPSSFSNENLPKSMTFNKDDLIFCKKEGNVFKYMKETCDEGNTTIRFDPIIKEITFNEPPSQFTMMCK